MRKVFLVTAAAGAAVLAAATLHASNPLLSPGEIVRSAPRTDWTVIPPDDLLVMELAPDSHEQARRVVIQLMPAPFSQGWVGNIRKLAAEHWWDGTSVNRVQDNYVVQWGDPDAEDAAKAKALPEGLATVPATEYETPRDTLDAEERPGAGKSWRDSYATYAEVVDGWPLASDANSVWPVHCYGMVGVGRNMPPDTGSGAELYVVIGHAPRQLDRNIALVGRVIEGIEHLSSLPRGTGEIGFYQTAEERVPILSIRQGTEVADLPGYEYLSTGSASFASYADARANRRDEFFIRPAGSADICNVPVPVRRVKG
jgi:peptidylprolyl isomerase